MKKCQLLTVTYDKDLEWLKYCIRSIDQSAQNYSGHSIIVDSISSKNVSAFLQENSIDFSVNSESCKVKYGYIRQQYIKMFSDKYVPIDTDWIVHIDSDSIFYEQHDPSIYFSKNNKPIMLMTPYDAFKNDEVPWQKPTEEFMKDNVKYEFMRRMPLIYPKWIFAEIREWFKKTHNKTLLEYLTNKNQIEFSEYNAIGAYMYKYHRNIYEWIDITKQPYEILPMLQMRSWDGIDGKIKIIKSLIENPEIHFLLKSIMQELNLTVDYRDIRMQNLNLLLNSAISKRKLDKQ